MRVKWGAPALGTAGEEVTYGFAGAVTSYPDALNCRVLAPADRLAAAAGGEQRLREVVDRRLRALERRRRHPLPSGTAAARSPTSSSGRRAGRTASPSPTSGRTGRARRAGWRRWRGRRSASTRPWPGRPTAAPGALDLGTVLAHEIGHVIGLDHPGPTGALMGYRDQGDVDRLMAGDIAGSVALYGPAKN